MEIEGRVNEIGAVIVDRQARIVGDGIIIEVENTSKLKHVEVYAPAVVLTDSDLAGYRDDRRAISDLIGCLIAIGAGGELFSAISAGGELFSPSCANPIDVAVGRLRRASGSVTGDAKADRFFFDVGQELRQARMKHEPMHSLHEAFAVILEEVDELKAHVWKKQSERDPAQVYAEIVHIAAMCARCVVDCSGDEFKR